jgi:hypothetical protein
MSTANPSAPDATTVRYGSRYASTPTASAGRVCSLCQGPLVSARAQYCSDACKQRACRLRQVSNSTGTLDEFTADLRRLQTLVAHTIYECPTCESRFLGERRCPDCHISCRRLGLGGLCPHCDEPVLLTDLLDLELLPSTDRTAVPSPPS